MLSLVGIIYSDFEPSGKRVWRAEERSVFYWENLTSLLQKGTKTKEKRQNTLQADIDLAGIKGSTDLMDSEVQYGRRFHYAPPISFSLSPPPPMTRICARTVLAIFPRQFWASQPHKR